MDKIKVGIIGYGTIGKRVADAVKLQPDMELIGVTARSYTFRMEVAKKNNIPLYMINGEREKFIENGIIPKGDFEDLLKQIDIVVDCTPGKIGAQLKKEVYEPRGIPAIFQGGEKDIVGDVSFNAFSNYDDAKGKRFVRVVSCNTTGMARLLYTINNKWPIKKARVTLIRRGADPSDTKKGPINSIVPVLQMPSHHGPDVNTVLPGVKVMTTAFAVPTTLMHVHSLAIELKGEAPTKNEVRDLLMNTSRMFMIRSTTGIHSTAQIMELVKDLYHQRGDVMDNCIWENGIGVVDNEIFIIQAIHQESDVIPDNIDCIRAMMGTMEKEESIALTNRTLGIK